VALCVWYEGCCLTESSNILDPWRSIKLLLLHLVGLLYYFTYIDDARSNTYQIQSTLHTAYGLCKNVSLAVLFGSNGNSYTISTQSYMCVHVYIFFII
jgi:hypothetical protein